MSTPRFLKVIRLRPTKNSLKRVVKGKEILESKGEVTPPTTENQIATEEIVPKEALYNNFNTVDAIVASRSLQGAPGITWSANDTTLLLEKLNTVATSVNQYAKDFVNYLAGVDTVNSTTNNEADTAKTTIVKIPRVKKENLAQLENEIKDALYIYRAFLIDKYNKKFQAFHPAILKALIDFIDYRIVYWQKAVYRKTFFYLDFVEYQLEKQNQPALTQDERYAYIIKTVNLLSSLAVALLIAAALVSIFYWYESVYSKIKKGTAEIEKLQGFNNSLAETIKILSREAESDIALKTLTTEQIAEIQEEIYALMETLPDDQSLKQIKVLNRTIASLSIQLRSTDARLESISNIMQGKHDLFNENLQKMEENKQKIAALKNNSFIAAYCNKVYESKKETVLYALSNEENEPKKETTLYSLSNEEQELLQPSAPNNKM